MNGSLPPVTTPHGGDGGARTVQFSNKSTYADKLTIEWFVEHNAVCCICGSVLDSYDASTFDKHARLKVVVCTRCSSALTPDDFYNVENCMWCGRDGSNEQANDGVSGFRVCSTADCCNKLCDRCLRSNFTKTQIASMLTDWSCFDCNPRSISPHQLYAEGLAEFARRFRRPVFSGQDLVPAPTGASRTRFLNSVKTLLMHLKSESAEATLSAKDLEEHIELAQKLRTELSSLQISCLKREPVSRTTSTAAPPLTNTSSNVTLQVEPGRDAECLDVAIKSEILETFREGTDTISAPPSGQDTTDGVESSHQNLAEIVVKTELEETQLLTQRRKEGSDADSNETLNLEPELAAKPSSDVPTKDNELNRLLGSINRRHFKSNQDNGAGATNAAASAAATPSRSGKLYEEPFLSSDEESDVLNTSRGDATLASFSRDDGPLIVLSSDDELLDYNSSEEDDAEDGLSPEKWNSPESSSDERSTGKSGRSLSDNESEAVKISVRRGTVPSLPHAAPHSVASTGTKRKMSEDSKTDKTKERPTRLPDGNTSDELPSDLESVGGDETQPVGRAGRPAGATTLAAKRLKRVSLHSDDSASESDVAKKTNASIPKKFTKQCVKVNKPPARAEPETCVISSDDEDFVPPVTNAVIKTEVGTSTGRKNIREMLSGAQLSKATLEANSREKERRKRIEEMQRKYNQFELSALTDGEDVKCVLEFDPVSKQPLVQVDPQLSRRMKTHQLEGVKFMYQNLVESVAKLRENSPGTGAILGHCMGLGKTFQVVCFLHTLMTHPKLKDHFKTVLVISPLNVIATWQEEISRWVERDPKVSGKLTQYSLHKENLQALRLHMLEKWHRSGGIMLMTPNLLTSLLGRETQAGQQRRNRQGADIQVTQRFKGFLCDPGPQVLIVDEGHTLKKNSTQLTQIVDRMIKTTRKILLTGTPLQNNLTEYFTMVSIVSPHLLGTKAEYRNRFEHPITNGQYKNSTATDIRKMRQRASVLKKLLESVVHRRDLSVLQSMLPPRHDYVITIRLSALQEELYEKFLNLLVSKSKKEGKTSLRRLLQDFVSLRSVWTHPKLLLMPKKFLGKKKKFATVSDMLGFDSIAPSDAVSNEPHRDWFKPLIGDRILDDVTLGPKIFILSDIIQNCGMIGDKLVVFCTQLSALDLIEFILSLMSKNRIGEGRWIVDKDYFRMDGKTSAEDRHRFFKLFNDPSNTRARLFLVSTNAGKLGSTLVGANRMVLLDTSWNPADDNQAVYRIYRIGQSKPVFIYRFVAFGTMEAKIYARNILKESTSCRVLDDSNMERHFTHEDVRDLYTFTPYDASSRRTPGVPKDKMLAELILRHPELIVDVHEHQQMLQNLEDDLSEEDRRIAWDEYQREKEEPAPNPAPAATNIPSGLDMSAFTDFRVIEECNKFWKRPDVTDTERLRIAPQFRNATTRSREHMFRAQSRAKAELADAIKRGQFRGEVLQKMVMHVRSFDETDAALRGYISMIDQLIQRAQLTPIPRSAQPTQFR